MKRSFRFLVFGFSFVTSAMGADPAPSGTPLMTPPPSVTPTISAMPNPQAASVSAGIMPSPVASPAPALSAPNAVTPPSPAVTTVPNPPPSQTAMMPPSSGSVDYKKFRDPFKEPSVSEALILKSDLERYAVTDFKVTGIVTGPIRMRAMLLAPDGKTHYVSENMKLGLRDGVIVKITTKTVVVREKVVNPLGEVEQFDTEIGIDQAPVGGDER